jgi:hypothetical protein
MPCCEVGIVTIGATGAIIMGGGIVTGIMGIVTGIVTICVIIAPS